MLLLVCLQVLGDARNMRRQMVDRAIAGLDKLESMHKYAMAGGSTAGGGSPLSTPRQPTAAQSLGAELPLVSDAAAAEGAGAEDDYQYVPTKVCRVL